MPKDAIIRELEGEGFFQGLPSRSLAFLAECASEQELRNDEVLFRSGDRAESFYLIRGGSVTVEVPAITGPALEIQTLEPGSILGWSWLIPPYRWSFQARAEVATTLLRFDGDAVRTRCEHDQTFGYDILKRFAALMSDRLDAARRRMMDEWNPPGFA